MKNIKNIKNIFKKVAALTFASAVLFSITGLSATATPSVTINSPTNSATLANGGTIPVSGTAPANTRVKILLDNVQVVTVVVDGAGAWSTTLTNVSKGTHTLKATNAGPGLHYFAAAGTPSQLHSIDPLTGSVDTKAGFPINLNGLTPVAAASPDGRYVYASGFYLDAGNLQRVDLETGTVEQVSGYPPSASVQVGSFNTESSKYYAPNDDGTVTIVDVATNTILQTLVTGASTHNGAVAIDDKIYVSDINSGQLFIITTSDDSITTITPACPLSGKAVTVVPDPDDSNVIWSNCDNGYLLKIDKTTHTSILTIAMPGFGAGITRTPGKNKVFVANPSVPEAYVFDSNTGALLQTIALPNQGYSPVSSSDGLRVLLAVPGGSFSGTGAVIIDANDYSLTNLTLSGPTIGMFAGPDTVAEVSIQFTVSGVLASTGQNGGKISLFAGAIAVTSIGILAVRKRRLLN